MLEKDTKLEEFNDVMMENQATGLELNSNLVDLLDSLEFVHGYGISGNAHLVVVDVDIPVDEAREHVRKHRLWQPEWNNYLYFEKTQPPLVAREAATFAGCQAKSGSLIFLSQIDNNNELSALLSYHACFDFTRNYGDTVSESDRDDDRKKFLANFNSEQVHL